MKLREGSFTALESLSHLIRSTAASPAAAAAVLVSVSARPRPEQELGRGQEAAAEAGWRIRGSCVWSWPGGLQLAEDGGRPHSGRVTCAGPGAELLKYQLGAPPGLGWAGAGIGGLILSYPHLHRHHHLGAGAGGGGGGQQGGVCARARLQRVLAAAARRCRPAPPRPDVCRPRPAPCRGRELGRAGAALW